MERQRVDAATKVSEEVGGSPGIGQLGVEGGVCGRRLVPRAMLTASAD